MRLGVRAALVEGEVLPGDVVVEDGQIDRVGVEPAGRAGLAVPGFVDLQVNGFGGRDFGSADVDGYREAGEALAATGVTAYQPTLISSPPGAYPEALGRAARAQGGVSGPRILGVHLEGPFLSPLWAGAHDPSHLVDPDPGLADRWCEAGPVAYVTLAPERPGGLELISHLVRRGITVAIGHTDADTATAHAAFDRGAGAITHLHNAHRRWSHRDPGPAGAALVRPQVVVQAIVDHVHLAPEAAYAAFLAARGRFALVTDAIAAAGLGEGEYPLGDRTVRVEGGEARLADGTLAGSVLTMDRAVGNLIGLGVPEVEALEAASRVPAGLVGRPELGTLRPGTPADLVVLDDRYWVVRTLVDGEEVFAR